MNPHNWSPKEVPLTGEDRFVVIMRTLHMLAQDLERVKLLEAERLIALRSLEDKLSSLYAARLL